VQLQKSVQSKAIVGKLVELFGGPANAAVSIEFLLEYQLGTSIRVPYHFPTPDGVTSGEFFLKAEAIGFFHRVGENENGVEGFVWGVSRSALEAARAEFASN
jgi:hypothetical protein